MKKTPYGLIFVAFALVLSAVVFSYTVKDPFRTDLIAGRHIDVGDVHVWNDGESLYVKYVTTGDWCLRKTHLHVDVSLDSIPQTKKGNPKPGRFNYKGRLDPCAREFLYTIPLEWDPETELFIAARAVVLKGSEREGAWAAGLDFPGKNWATYFKYTVQTPAPVAFISGTVFDDASVDGVWDTDELGISDVLITLDDMITVTTELDGSYTFEIAEAGIHTVVETDPEGFVSTTPNTVTLNVYSGEDYEVNFGDALRSSVITATGKVWEDLDVDDLPDDNEPGLAGSVISLSTGLTQTTGTEGDWLLYGPPNTVITITATHPEDDEGDPYAATNAIPGDYATKIDAVRIRLQAIPEGETSFGNLFGAVERTGVITTTGYVWEDLDRDGYLDYLEPDLAGTVISMSTGLSQTVGMDGYWTLYGPPDTVITVTATHKGGYAATNAIPGDYATKIDNTTILLEPMSAGDTSFGNLFGAAMPKTYATISGTVFYDQNENGHFDDPGETGFEGVYLEVEVYSVITDTFTVVTDSNGDYSFTVECCPNIKITCSGPGGDYYRTTLDWALLRLAGPGEYPDNNFGYSCNSCNPG